MQAVAARLRTGRCRHGGPMLGLWAALAGLAGLKVNAACNPGGGVGRRARAVPDQLHQVQPLGGEVQALPAQLRGRLCLAGRQAGQAGSSRLPVRVPLHVGHVFQALRLQLGHRLRAGWPWKGVT